MSDQMKPKHFVPAALLLFALASCDRMHEVLDLGHDVVLLKDPTNDDLSLNYRVNEGDYVPIEHSNFKCLYTNDTYVLIKNEVTINNIPQYRYFLLPFAKVNPQELDDALIGPLGNDAIDTYIKMEFPLADNQHCF